MSPDQNIGLAPHSPAICNQCGNLSSLSLSLCLPLLFIFTPTAKIHLYSTVNWSVLYVLFEVFPLVKSFQVTYFTVRHIVLTLLFFLLLVTLSLEVLVPFHSIHISSHLAHFTPRPPFHSFHCSSHFTHITCHHISPT